MTAKPKASVFTLGCKTNQYESRAVMQRLSDYGYEVTDKLEPADLIVINTCAVTAEAERKSLQIVRRARNLKPDCGVIVLGCGSSIRDNALKSIDGVEFVGNALNKMQVIDKYLGIESPQNNTFSDKEYQDNLIPYKVRTRDYIKIQDGCNNYCAYCIVPYLRGASRSRAPESIINEINASNAQEIVIGGINITDYNYEGKDFTWLIGQIGHLKPRIRLSSLHIQAINRPFLEAMKGGNYCPHFHLSIQSLSNDVLKAMNRRYSAEDVINAADLIREYFPDAMLTSDLIAGFPGESEQNHRETLANVERVNLSYIHIFPYSARPGTKAYLLKDLEKSVKRARVKELEEVREKLYNAYIERMTGKEATILVEQPARGYMTGHTEHYLKAYLPGSFEPDSLIKGIIEGRFRDGVLLKMV